MNRRDRNNEFPTRRTWVVSIVPEAPGGAVKEWDCRRSQRRTFYPGRTVLHQFSFFDRSSVTACCSVLLSLVFFACRDDSSIPSSETPLPQRGAGNSARS